jgi:hypothetical protein
VQLQLDVAELERPRRRQHLDLAERQGRGALDVELGILTPQLALRRPGLTPQALGRCLAEAERQAGEGEPSQEVVVVGVSGEQRVGLEARLGQEARQCLELVREVGRVDQQRLTAGAQRRGGRLPDAARDHERVAVDRHGPHRAKRP